MAPTKDEYKKKQQYHKESILFKYCKKGPIDSRMLGIHSCERNFGFKFSDLSIEEMKKVVWGVRSGQAGYFLSPELVATVKLRVDKTFIPEDWISSSYLKKCFERKGGEPDGFIKSFHADFARLGKKKNQKGRTGYFFPRSFLKETLDTAIISDRFIALRN